MHEATPIKILVASTSRHKLAAVAEAAQPLFGGRLVTVEGIEVPSKVNAQPVGLVETTRGAENRLKAALTERRTHYDYAVALENGLMVTGKIPLDRGTRQERPYTDNAICIARRLRDSKQYTAMSAGVLFPKREIAIARKRGFNTTTVGAVIAELNPGVDPTDPHTFLTKGATTHRDQLREAASEALKRVTG